MPERVFYSGFFLFYVIINSMKRVAFIVDELERVFPSKPLKGGGYLVARYLILEFAKRKDIELYIFSGKSNPVEIDGVKEIIILETSPHIFNHQFLIDIKELTYNKFDFTMFLTMMAPFENVLLQAHSSEYRYTNSKNCIESWLIKNLYGKEKIKYTQSRFSDENKQFFAVSKRLKDDYVKYIGINPELITVSYPGVEIKECEKKQNDIFTFAMPSGTSKNKGVLDLILAMFLLKITGKKFKLNAILSTPKKNRFILFLMQILGVRNNLNIWERQIDMANFYCSADCVLMPSLNESFGLVPLEASACKVPAIVSSTTGVAEIFEDGKNAIIYDKSKFAVLNLYKSMKKILDMYNKNNDEYNKIANNAYELAKQYTWYNFADVIYNKIMEK